MSFIYDKAGVFLPSIPLVGVQRFLSLKSPIELFHDVSWQEMPWLCGLDFKQSGETIPNPSLLGAALSHYAMAMALRCAEAWECKHQVRIESVFFGFLKLFSLGCMYCSIEIVLNQPPSKDQQLDVPLTNVWSVGGIPGLEDLFIDGIRMYSVNHFQ